MSWPFSCLTVLFAVVFTLTLTVHGIQFRVYTHTQPPAGWQLMSYEMLMTYWTEFEQSYSDNGGLLLYADILSTGFSHCCFKFADSVNGSHSMLLEGYAASMIPTHVATYLFNCDGPYSSAWTWEFYNYVEEWAYLSVTPEIFSDGYDSECVTNLNFGIFVDFTDSPTNAPSDPTSVPTIAPTEAPSNAPFDSPTSVPSDAPYDAPTATPSSAPTSYPTDAPTTAPSGAPSSSPIGAPTDVPSLQPTGTPTASPTILPSGVPTARPTDEPSNQPSVRPSVEPTLRISDSTTQAALAATEGEVGGITEGEDSDTSLLASNLQYLIISVGIGALCGCAALIVFCACRRRKRRMGEQDFQKDDKIQIKHAELEMQASSPHLQGIQRVQSLSPTGSGGSFDMMSFGDIDTAGATSATAGEAADIIGTQNDGLGANSMGSITNDEFVVQHLSQHTLDDELPQLPQLPNLPDTDVVAGINALATADADGEHAVRRERQAVRLAVNKTEQEGGAVAASTTNARHGMNGMQANLVAYGVNMQLPQQPQIGQMAQQVQVRARVQNTGTKAGVTVDESDSDNELFQDMTPGGIAKTPITQGQEATTHNDQKHGEMMEGASTDAVGLMVGTYEGWDEKQVLLWLRVHLKKNGLSDEVVETFLKEFETKRISGKILKQCKMHPEWMDNLVKQFSEENQAFGIWMVIKTAVNAVE